MKISLKEDLEKITTIKAATFNKLNDRVLWCISDGVEKAIKAKDDTLEADLIYGKLLIKIDGNEVKYKFIPNDCLIKVVNDTVINEQNQLTLNLEDSLVQQLSHIYKDLGGGY